MDYFIKYNVIHFSAHCFETNGYYAIFLKTEVNYEYKPTAKMKRGKFHTLAKGYPFYISAAKC